MKSLKFNTLIKNIKDSFGYKRRKKLYKFIILVFTIGVLIMLVMNFKNISEGDWQAIAAIGQVLGAIATTAAVIVALQPKKPRIDIDFKMMESNDEENFVAKLHIFNISESIAIIHEIRFELNKNRDESLISYESFNSLRNNHRDYRDPISILPFQKESIEFTPNQMLWGIGHTIGKPNRLTKNKLVNIIIVVNNKEFKFPTTISYENYYNNFTCNI